MLEAELQKAVLALAKRLGWRTAHFRPGLTKRGTWQTAVQGDGAGFPDCILLRDDRLIFAELKQDKRYPTPEQRQWLDGLEKVAEVFVWRPADYPDKIAAVLR